MCDSKYTYDIAANWKQTYDNFQENYNLRFIHPRSGEAAFAAQNPFGYPKEYAFHGQHRTQTIRSNPEAQAKPHQAAGFGRLMPGATEAGILATPFGRQYFALFPSIFMLGTPLQNFVHQVWPTDAGHSRGVSRIYWVGEDRSASERFGREMILATVRDVHAEGCR